MKNLIRDFIKSMMNKDLSCSVDAVERELQKESVKLKDAVDNLLSEMVPERKRDGSANQKNH